MRLLACVALVTAAGAEPPQLHRVLARVTQEADAFYRSAHRIAGTETLRQTVGDGVRTSRGPRGAEVLLPSRTTEIVSEYGFIAADEPGAPIREVRRVLTIDGLPWNSRRTRDADTLADQIRATRQKDRRKSLERFEEHGLFGVATDVSQMLLLFARGGAAKMELVYDRDEPSGPHGTLVVFRYNQLEGEEGVTIYEGDEVVKKKSMGELWVRATDLVPVRVTMNSVREVNDEALRDVLEVRYDMGPFGFVLPSYARHQQFAGGEVIVTTEYTYTSFREVLPDRRRK
jgi:hypothetical protein